MPSFFSAACISRIVPRCTIQCISHELFRAARSHNSTDIRIPACRLTCSYLLCCQISMYLYMQASINTSMLDNDLCTKKAAQRESHPRWCAPSCGSNASIFCDYSTFISQCQKDFKNCVSFSISILSLAPTAHISAVHFQRH
jgi:hypothetical protein